MVLIIFFLKINLRMKDKEVEIKGVFCIVCIKLYLLCKKEIRF